MARSDFATYSPVMLSVIIPTLQAGETLEVTLQDLTQSSSLISEIIISDGGSADKTLEIAKTHHAQIVTGLKGRGPQLALGAKAATNAWFLFLHADTRLSAGWQQEVQDFIKKNSSTDQANQAGVFKFALDDHSHAARRLERAVAWRCRKWALPYGDQGLLISKTLYTKVGGYRNMPLFEDVDIIRRIGRHRLKFFESCALTSAIRYQKNGYFLRPLRNLLCLSLYFAGLPPRLIRKLY